MILTEFLVIYAAFLAAFYTAIGSVYALEVALERWNDRRALSKRAKRGW